MVLTAASREVLATHVVQYVQRTRKLVVLGHAAVHGLFVEDPYIVSHRSKSILSETELTAILDPISMTKPGGTGAAGG